MVKVILCFFEKKRKFKAKQKYPELNSIPLSIMGKNLVNIPGSYVKLNRWTIFTK
jgi:hypothetical protein